MAKKDEVQVEQHAINSFDTDIEQLNAQIESTASQLIRDALITARNGMVREHIRGLQQQIKTARAMLPQRNKSKKSL